MSKSKSGAPGVGNAMIFSAGLGTRFKPWTDKHPKALALVNGKSLLQRNLEYLQQFGISNVIVNVHHFAEQVVEAIKNNDGWGSNVIISDETDKVLETGGGLLKAKDLFVPDQRFITCNVDILTDLDIGELIHFHETRRPLISFGVTDRKTSRYFLFDDHDRLCGWRNTRTGEERIEVPGDVLIEKAYSCVVVFEYDVFRLMPMTGKFSLTDVYLDLAKEHLILGYDHSGDQLVDVGKPESVDIAEKIFP
ncbi:MAG: NTP transferase domain-containing protein [Chitinophagaceae bacterium]|nr:NTP transferase domain-containing protein [Chitinophagaceae bacterium]